MAPASVLIVKTAIPNSMIANATNLFLVRDTCMMRAITASKKGAAAMARLNRRGRMKCELTHKPTYDAARSEDGQILSLACTQHLRAYHLLHNPAHHDYVHTTLWQCTVNLPWTCQ
eukprot:366131-Chlamydomonas_euryale.AAC.36